MLKLNRTLFFHKTLTNLIGLKFFDDELGMNRISQLNAGKERKKNIEPITFNGRDIFCSYYYNKHQLSPFEADLHTSTLSCKIYGISKDWNVSCWLADSLASSLMKATDDSASVGKLSRLLRLLADTFDYINGPSVIKQLLAKLITRTARKLRFLIRN